jgi:hypothetical protein
MSKKTPFGMLLEEVLERTFGDWRNNTDWLPDGSFFDTVENWIVEGTVPQTSNFLEFLSALEIAEPYKEALKTAYFDLKVERRKIRTEKSEVVFELPSHFSWLPTPNYARLWGVSKNQVSQDLSECRGENDVRFPVADRLEAYLLSDNALRVVNVTGIGGLGKTSVVHYVAQRLGRNFANKFAGLCWVGIDSLDPMHFAQLSEVEMSRRVLKVVNNLCIQLDLADIQPLSKEQKIALMQKKLLASENPYIIIIDNLQSPEDIKALTDIISELSRNSWIIMTCRGTLLNRTKISFQEFQVMPLGCSDTIQMCQWEADNRERQIPQVFDASTDISRRVWKVTQGHPQAIQVLLAQMTVVDPPLALRLLEQGMGDTLTDVYLNIYGAAWQSISNFAREILSQIALGSGQGTTLDELLAAFSDGDEGNYTDAEYDRLATGLSELYQRSLINVDQPQGRLIYSVHQITYNFIRSVIMRLEGVGEFNV